MFRQKRAVVVKCEHSGPMIKPGKYYMVLATFTDGAGKGFVELDEVKTAGGISIPIRKEHFVVALGIETEVSAELELEKILSEPYKGNK